MSARPIGLRLAFRGEGLTHAVLVCVVSLFCGLPLVLLFQLGLTADGAFGLAGVWDALQSRTVQRALWNSLESSFLAALGATLVGLVLALLIGLTNIRRKGVLVFLVLLPMMIPPHVTAIAWIQALGPASPVLSALGLAPQAGATHPIYSLGGIVALLTIQHAPLVFLVVRAALRNFPRELSDAARISGAGPWRMMRTVIVPLLSPALFAGFTLAFIAALGNFGILALLGIPARYTTLPVLIWRRLASFGPDMLQNVAVISIILALVTLSVLTVQILIQRRLRLSLIGLPQAPLAIDLGRGRLIAEICIWGLLAVILVLPMASLLATALVPTYGVPLSWQTLTFDNFVEVITRQSVTLRAFMNSSVTAGVAAVLIAGIAIGLGHALAARRSLSQRVANIASGQAELAYAIPGLVISIAFILAFIRPLPLLNITLYGTIWIILLAYVSAFLAIGLKPVAAAYTQLDPSLDDAARAAGATYITRMRRVFAPLVAPAAVSGAILVFLTAYNEVTVSALLWSTGAETIGTVIFNYEDGGYTTLSAAMAALTVAMTAVLMVALNLTVRRLPPGVIPWRD
ncbi:MAG: iron ABC transporter permease [Pseudomonadota bacterium]